MMSKVSSNLKGRLCMWACVSVVLLCIMICPATLLSYGYIRSVITMVLSLSAACIAGQVLGELAYDMSVTGWRFKAIIASLFLITPLMNLGINYVSFVPMLIAGLVCLVGMLPKNFKKAYRLLVPEAPVYLALLILVTLLVHYTSSKPVAGFIANQFWVCIFLLFQKMRRLSCAVTHIA